ncbi:MAG: family 16 glycosylhydrolase [Capnocytophaga sp.]|nr:family 16 glycosylhydrolase [Capnocytophaga sp.]
MKSIKCYIQIFLLMTASLAISSCKEEYSVGDITSPSQVEIKYEIVGVDSNNPHGDGSGYVNFTITANNAITYRLDLGDGKTEMTTSGILKYRYTKIGTNKYTVVASAVGAGGTATSKTIDIEVFSSFADAEAENLLAGKNVGDSKTWYWAADVVGYAALGPQENGEFSFGAWWQAPPFDATRTCMFENSFIFSRTSNGITFEQTADYVFVPGAYASVLGVEGNKCYGTDVIPSLKGKKLVSFAPSSSKAALQGTYDNAPYRKTSFELSDKGMLGWWVGSSTYDIIKITDKSLIVRIMQPNSEFAWYHIFSSTKPTKQSSFSKLVWSDEFDKDGVPDSTKWTYDLGRGNNGWGNNELQTYTNNSENVFISGGTLKITAKADGNGGYTSARLKTENLYQFTYGKVEIRAKLPATQGTWPALWMLGSNFATDGWPRCGEIDIMEQTGDDKASVLGATHWLNTANNTKASHSLTTAVQNTSSEFHIYTMEWTAEAIKYYVDGVQFFELTNNASLPFNANFFLIMNVAIGGNLGKTVDPNFTSDTMEVDYVRVYQ